LSRARHNNTDTISPQPLFPNPRFQPAASQPPIFHRGASAPAPPPAVAPGCPQRRNSLLRRGLGTPPDSFLQSPFRTRGAAVLAAGRPPRRLSAARLWNPTNSTPRTPAATSTTSHRKRRPSTPPPPSIPLAHPAEVDQSPTGLQTTSLGDRPLLALPEQRQNLQQPSSRASLQLERSAGNEQRISLPVSVRHSYDEKRINATPSPEAGPSTRLAPEALSALGAGLGDRSVRVQTRDAPVGLSFHQAGHRDNKGKGKEIMSPEEANNDGRDGFSQDLERGPGPDVLNNRHSTASRISGIGSAISSSNSSIMGEDQQPDAGEEWGPQHPCYPHLNPHVPIDSPEYTSTRIIRIRRDWLIEGDLAPTFSNLYPEILDPAGVNEQEFRRIIEKLNSELIPIFSPFNWRNILDGVLGLATGWLWDDLGLTATKMRLRRLENWIEQWNKEMAKTYAADDSTIPPRIIPLKRTGYMTVGLINVFFTWRLH